MGFLVVITSVMEQSFRDYFMTPFHTEILTGSCERKLRDTINWQHPPNDTSKLSRILSAAEKNIVFLTPTLAFGLYPDDRGRTWILPLARYVMPPKVSAQGKTAAATAPIFRGV
ncbi:hypothetical protein ABIB42_004251 [Massilia sp. UYP32]